MEVGAKIAVRFADVESDVAVFADIAGGHRHIEQFLRAFVVAARAGDDAFDNNALFRHVDFLVFAAQFKKRKIVPFEDDGVFQSARVAEIGKGYGRLR